MVHWSGLRRPADGESEPNYCLGYSSGPRTDQQVSKKPATPHNLQKWHRTTSATMTDFANCLAKNHAIKNPIEPKYAPGSLAQYGRAPLLSAKGKTLEGVRFTQRIEDGAFLGRRGEATIIHLNFHRKMLGYRTKIRARTPCAIWSSAVAQR
jgi:hypothetical protein